MRRETFEPQPSEPAEEFKAEVQDNVREFVSKEKPAEHAVEHILKEAGAHDSAVLLSDSELKQAEDELVALKEQQKEILSLFNKGLRVLGLGKKKARDINKSMSVKNLPEISQRIHKLESNIAFTKARPEVATPMSKEEFGKLNPHQRSTQILKDAGYNSIAEARAAHLASGESKDSTLGRMIRTAALTAPKDWAEEKSDVVYVPESVWPGSEKPKPDEKDEEQKKAA